MYSLGAILYELLAGQPPFLADSPLETLRLVTGADPVPPSQLNPKTPRELEAICLKCLHKNPAARYASARELAEELDRFPRNEPILAYPLRAVGRGKRWCRRNPSLTSVFALGLVLLLAGTAMGFVFAIQQSRAAGLLKAERARTLDALADTELQRDRAGQLLREARAQQLLAQCLSARLALDHGQTLCEGGELGPGSALGGAQPGNCACGSGRRPSTP